MRKLAVTVVILALLAVAVDRVGEYVAERMVADRIQQREGLATAPNVEFGGFPFVTQVLDREFSSVEVSLATATAAASEQHSLRVLDIEADFRDVRASEDFRQAVAASMRGRATVPFTSIEEIAPVQVTYGGAAPEGDGLLTITPDDSRLPSFSVRVGSLGGTSVGFLGADGSTRLPFGPRLNKELGDLLRPHNLAGLPSGFRLESVDVTSDGIELVLAGRAVQLG